MYSKHNSNNKNINKGLLILKIYLSFSVVASHSFITSKKFGFQSLLMNHIHVPCFFEMSFYFFYKTLISRNLDRYKQRLNRLLIPYIIWPIIIIIINYLLNHFLTINLKHSLNDLKNQILTGHSFIYSFWFQWDLIFITVIFIFIEFIFKKNLIFILINIELFALFFQYSSLNYQFFSKFIFEMRYTFGRFAESLPFSISGFMLAHFQIIFYFQKYYIKTIYILNKYILI